MTWMRVEEMEKKMQKCAEDPKERMTTPQADGFFMPGEYEPHDGCILIWACRLSYLAVAPGFLDLRRTRCADCIPGCDCSDCAE